MASTPTDLDALVAQKYQHGFVTDVESDTLPPGLDEDVVRVISRIKREPQFMLDWRLRALRHWQTMANPHWAHLRIAPIDYQSISYYSAPRAKTDGPKSLDEVDPKLLATYEKLGVPLHERARLAGVAVDAVFDVLAPAVEGFAADDQRIIDQVLIEVDGTENKQRVGANAILGICCAI